MGPKQQAIKDIKEELKSYGRCFIAFHRELNKPIRGLVNEYLRKQRALK